MSVRRSLAALSVVSVLFVAGCSEEPEPIFSTPTPTPTESTPSPTETATVDPLAIPAAAKKPTKAGAEAMIRHFWDMVAYLRETGDAKPVRKTYRDSCAYCVAGVDYFESALRRGSTFDGDSEHPVRITVSLLDSASKVPGAYAVVTTEAGKQVERDAEGKDLVRIPGGTARNDYFLEFESGSWTIANVEDPK